MSSKYVSTNSRLGDVIAAIQTLGLYRRYRQTPDKWADRITGNEGSASYWEAVFREHPEFFRFNSKESTVSLVWRRQHSDRQHIESANKINYEEYKLLSSEEQKKYSRSPLRPEEVGILIDCAIKLHQQAIENSKEKRWWVYILIGFGGAILGGGATIAAAILRS